MTWSVVRAVSAKPQGYVWEVRERQPAGGRGLSPGTAPRRGFFKFTLPQNRYWGGPAAANELIAAGLARLIGLDVADVELACVDGHLGVVSVVRPAAHLVNWRALPAQVQRHVRRYVANAHQFRAMLVFDAWVLNIDRAKNVIAYKRRHGAPWRVYFIDHGHTLHGNYDRWRWGGPYRSPFWNDLWRYYDLPPGIRAYVASYRQVAPYVQWVQRIKPEQIRRVIRSVPKGLLTAAEAGLIERLLLWRQKRLSFILRRWFAWRKRAARRAVLAMRKGRKR